MLRLGAGDRCGPCGPRRWAPSRLPGESGGARPRSARESRLIGPRGRGPYGPGRGRRVRRSRGRPPGFSSLAACACQNRTYVSWLPRVWRSEIRVSILGVFRSRGQPPGLAPGGADDRAGGPEDGRRPRGGRRRAGTGRQRRGDDRRGGRADVDARIALRNHGARSLPGNLLASVDSASCLVVWEARRSSSSVRCQATLTLVNRASRSVGWPASFPCRAQRGKGRRAQRARFFPSPAARWRGRPGRRRANGARFRSPPVQPSGPRLRRSPSRRRRSV